MYIVHCSYYIAKWVNKLWNLSDYRLEVKERPDVGVYVKDLSVFMVNNADDMDKLMTMGNKNRSIGATQMNAHSSRSHAIFSITVECSEKGPDGQQHFRYIIFPEWNCF